MLSVNRLPRPSMFQGQYSLRVRSGRLVATQLGRRVGISVCRV